MQIFETYLIRNKININISLRAIGLALAFLLILFNLPQYQTGIFILLPIICGLLTILSLEAGIFFTLFVLIIPIFYSSVEFGILYLIAFFILIAMRKEISMQTLLLFTLFIALSRFYLPFGVLMLAAIYLSPAEAFWFSLIGCLSLEIFGLMFGISSLGGIYIGGTTPIWPSIANLPPINDFSWIPQKFSDSSFLTFYGNLFKSFINNPVLLILPLFWGGIGILVSKFSRWNFKNVLAVFALGIGSLTAIYFFIQIYFGITIQGFFSIFVSAILSYVLATSYVKLTIKFDEKTKVIDKILEKNRSKEKIPLRDTLTNLFTREFLEDRFDKIIEDAKKGSSPLSFVMVDIDRFKQINDTKGHQAGDSVLVDVAKILENTIDSNGTVVRYAGDEFCIIFPDVNAKKAKEIMNNTSNTLAKHNFKNLEHVLRPTLSIGISEFPIHTTDKEELIGFADQALYISKNLGRNTITLFGEDVFVEQALELNCWIELQAFITVNGKVRPDSWRIHSDSDKVEVVTLFEYTSMIPYVSNTAHQETETKTYKTSFLGKVLKITSMSPKKTEFVLLVQKADLPIKIKDQLNIE